MEANEMQELKELIEFLKANEIAEFDLERGELKVKLNVYGGGAGRGCSGVCRRRAGLWECWHGCLRRGGGGAAPAAPAATAGAGLLLRLSRLLPWLKRRSTTW